MSRTRTGAALALLALALLAVPGGSSGDSSSPTWAGTWDSDFGRMTLDAGGSGRYEGSSSGTIDGKVDGRVDQGTWDQPGNPHLSGTFKFTMSGDGLSFTGDWAYDSGGCGTACGWNGTCVAGPCLENDDPAATPTCTPRGADAFVALEYCPLEYGESVSVPAPAPGKAIDITPEPMPPDTRELLLEVIQELQQERLAAAVAATLKKPGGKETFDACIAFGEALDLVGEGDVVTYDGADGTRAAALRAACTKFILRKGSFAPKSASPARLAANGCTALFVPAFAKGTKVTRKRRARARAVAERQLRLSCRTTSGGRTTVSVKARRSDMTLNRLLGRRVRAPLARFLPRGTNPPAGERIGVRWRARKR